MTLLALIRHGPTEWNESGLVQSHTDVPLSAAGRKIVGDWRVPTDLAGSRWLSSPLGRAVETARILSGEQDIATDARLVEMDWGTWEGMDMKALRAEIGHPGEAWRAGGLDFRAPDGESQRDVQNRLLGLFAELSEAGTPTLATCHRGVVRATFALATGWDQTTSWPEVLRDDCVHLFALSTKGVPSTERLNIPLTDAGAE
jgi:probable phosphoglycerate mutase